MIRVCAVLGTLALVCTMATPAQAIPITEQAFVASGGVVVESELFQDGLFGEGVGEGFHNPTATVGTIKLGPVGLEDLFGGGDFDDNDLELAFSDVSPAEESGAGASVNVVDEPSSLMMFGFGLVALVFVMKRQTVRR